MGLEIFCDMDGVLCDFVSHAAPIFGTTLDDLLKKAKPNKYWIFEEALGINHTQFWEVANKQGPAFWVNVPEYPWARELYQELCKRGEVYLLSAPAPSSFCSVAKYEWVTQFTGDPHFDRFIPTKHKHLVAKPNRILIDDYNDNCDMFEKHSGEAIIFPQHWNRSHILKGHALQQTLFELDAKIFNMKKTGVI